jgi:tRNA G18 (ribose-2'-O)-methylase SpoU
MIAETSLTTTSTGTTTLSGADLDDKRFNYSVVCCNIGNDFNIATVIRNANAFLAQEVVIYGNKKYDRRGTVGTHHYTNFRHVRDINSLSDFFNSKSVECADRDKESEYSE